MNTARMQKLFDIYIAGLGIMSVRHITREAEEAIKVSKQVFFVDPGFGVEEFLQTLCSKTTNLLPHYRVGVDRKLTYKAMATQVIEAALEDSPVCFATYGHPQVYVYPTYLIKQAAALLDLNVHIIPGISAIDTILIDVGIDPGPQGLQMYEATDVLVRERPFQPDVPCLLWQVASLESALYSDQRGNSERFLRLEQYLLQIYPAEHPVTMVLSSTYPLLDPLKETFPLRELSSRLAQGLQSGTLYIPPIEQRTIRNQKLLREVYDEAHMREITSLS